MSAGYGRIAFTKAVQDEQEHHGSRRFYARHQARAEQAAGPDRLTGEVHDYLAERDNLQYISTGYLRSDDRVALIVMDYPNRQRLKIYGHATIHEADKVPELVAQLTRQGYDAVVARQQRRYHGIS